MEPKYEIYVRLPFNRGDFVDPPPVSVSVSIHHIDIHGDTLWIQIWS